MNNNQWLILIGICIDIDIDIDIAIKKKNLIPLRSVWSMTRQGICSTIGPTPTGLGSTNTCTALSTNTNTNTNTNTMWTHQRREFQQRISESQEVHGKMRTQLHLVDKEVFVQIHFKLQIYVFCLYHSKVVFLILIVKRSWRWTVWSTSLASLRKLSRVRWRFKSFIWKWIVIKTNPKNPNLIVPLSQSFFFCYSVTLRVPQS